MEALLGILKSAAPALATAVSGPAGGMAIKAIASKLGVADSVEAVTAHLTANPDAALKLREIDLKELEVHSKDRDSARNREVEMAKADVHFITKNITSLLAIGTLAGAMAMTALVFFVDFPDSQENIIIFVLGFLSSAATQVLSYYFGSSAGSKEKDNQIKGLLK